LTIYQSLQVNNTTWQYPSLPATLNNNQVLEQLPYALRTLLLALIQQPEKHQTDQIHNILDWPMQGHYGQSTGFFTRHLILSAQRSQNALSGLSTLMKRIGAESITNQGNICLEILSDSADVPLASTQPLPGQVELRSRDREENRPLLEIIEQDDKQVIQMSCTAGCTTLNASGIFSPSVCALSAVAPLAGEPLSLAATEIAGIKLQNTPAGPLTDDQVANAICTNVKNQANGGILEFFGPGLQNLPLPCRRLICQQLANEGITAFFPLDNQSLTAIHSHTALTEAWAQAQQVWHDASSPEPTYSLQYSIDLEQLECTETACSAVADRPAFNTDNCISNSESTADLKNGRIAALLTDNSIPAPATQASEAASIVFADDHYGCAQYPDLLTLAHQARGTTAIICPSFTTEQRRSLAYAGILPLEFQEGDCWQALSLEGDERIELDIPNEIYPYEAVVMVIHRPNGRRELVELTLRLDNTEEIAIHKAGGLLNHLAEKLEIKATQSQH